MAVIEVKYFNTFLIKKIANVVAASPQPTAPFADVPGSYSANTVEDWYVEESRIKGGYNNTTVDFGVKAYLDEEHPLQQHRFNTLIYSGIYNSRTGVNNTNQFSVAEDITRSVDPVNGSIQKLYAEDTNLIIFQEDKVSRALIDKDAIYSAEGNATVTSARLVIGQIVPYAGEYGISTDPFSFAVYGYRKYFTDKKRGCVLRLSSGGDIIEISGYGMHDFFRDELKDATRIVGAWDSYTKNYVLSLQNTQYRTGTGQVAQTNNDVTNTGNNVPLILNAGNTNIVPGMRIYSYTPSGQVTGTLYGEVVSVIQTTNPAKFTCNIGTEIPGNQPVIFWTQTGGFKTLSFDESVLGWTSFYSYEPVFITSLVSDFYSFYNTRIYKQNTGNYGQYYGICYDSDVTVVLNSDPSLVKNFKTLNYEGDDGWQVESMVASSGDTIFPIPRYTFQQTLIDLENSMFSTSFKKKENKYFANLINNSTVTEGEIIFGQDSSGIKGFFSTVVLKLNNVNYKTVKKELFAVSSDVVESSY